MRFDVESLISEPSSHPLVDAMPYVMIILNRSGEILWFNKACEKLIGYTLDEIRYKEIFPILIPSEQREAVINVFKDISSNSEKIAPQTTYQNYWLNKKGKKILPVLPQFTSFPHIYNTDSAQVGVTGTGTPTLHGLCE